MDILGKNNFGDLFKLLLIGVFVSSTGCSGDSSDMLPDQIHVYDSDLRLVSIEYEDPNVLTDSKNGYQMFMVLDIKDKGYISPLFYRETPKMVAGTRMSYGYPIWTDDYCYIPNDTDIEGLTLLVQGISSDKRGWRVFELENPKNVQTIKLPALDTMPLIENSPNADLYLQLKDLAIETYSSLRE